MSIHDETDLTNIIELLRLNGAFNKEGQARKARMNSSFKPYQPPKLVMVDLLNADGTVARMGCGYAVEVETETQR